MLFSMLELLLNLLRLNYFLILLKYIRDKNAVKICNFIKYFNLKLKGMIFWYKFIQQLRKYKK